MKSELRFGGLSSSSLKFIACVFMFIDHLGAIVFPEVVFLRIMGRLAFPIFAFFISEGSHYSKRPIKRIITMLSFGIVFDFAYFIAIKEPSGNVFLVFGISALLIFILQKVKTALFEDIKTSLKIFYVLLFVLTVTAVFVLNSFYHFDYGFWGIITPVLVSLPDFENTKAPEKLKKYNTLAVKLCLLTVGLLLIMLNPYQQWFQILAISAIILLAFYNGKPGRKKSKYFFYVFYPTHILLLYLISVFIK